MQWPVKGRPVLRKYVITAAIAIVAGFIGGQSLSQSSNSSMPNPAVEYHQRVNCHLGYDVVVERRNRKWTVSPAMDAWAQAHEAAARDRKPCPAMPDDLKNYSVNWLMMTPQGRASAQKFADQQNDPEATSELAMAYLKGQYPDVTPQTGVPLLQKAADMGDPVATFTVGTLYSSGIIDGTKNHKEGWKRIEQAANAGHIDAIFRSGLYLMDGIGTKKDPRKAFAAFQRAAERGHMYAAIMAWDVLNGGKVRQDWDLAYRLSRKVADQGQVYGAVMAASSLLQSRNPASHEDEILYWIDLAIARGDATIRNQMVPMRQQVAGVFSKPKAPPQYRPRVYKACPMKTVCTVNHYSGLQSCTTNKDYWSDCDG